MRLSWAVVMLVACSSEKAPEKGSADRPPPVDPIASAAAELDAELTRTFELARTLTAASTQPCGEDVNTRGIGSFTLDGLEALAKNTPLPPTAGLSNIDLFPRLRDYRAGTMKTQNTQDLLERVRSLRRLFIYEIKTFREWDETVEGEFEGRLRLIDLKAKTTICHIDLSFKKKREPDDLGDDGKPKAFRSYVFHEVAQQLSFK
jgi:hypothetical protein